MRRAIKEDESAVVKVHNNDFIEGTMLSGWGETATADTVSPSAMMRKAID